MILLEFKDGSGIDREGKRGKIFINPDQVTGIEQDRPGLTLVRTIPYAYLIKGSIEDIACVLMLPEMAEQAGTNISAVAELLQKEGEEG